MTCGDIIVSTRKNNPVSMFIRWWTNSKWSHTRVMTSSVTFVEATYPRVKVGHIDEMDGEVYRVLTPLVPLSDDEKADLKFWVVSDIGKKYDWRGLVSFLLHKNIQKKSFFFCSEFVAEAYEAIKRPLLRREACWTTPGDIYSTLELKEVA